MQKVSHKGLVEITSHEGIVLSPYLDSVGVWTVGIGHTANAGHPDPKTERREFSIAEIMEIFARDIEKFEARVRKAFGRTLTQEQFDAAVSFDFNTGGIHRASWVKRFNEGKDEEARTAFMAWRKPKEIILRREKERDLFFDGTYSSDGRVSVYPASSAGRVLWKKGKRVALPHIGGEAPAVASAPEVEPKEGSYQGPDSAWFPEAVPNNNLSYANQNAIRNLPVTVNLEEKISKAVRAVYGPHYRAEIYSGGQAKKGSGGRRTGSVRHDDGGTGGRAADIYVYDENNNRVMGAALAPLGQYWLASRFGACGMVMNGGGVHLDEWTTPPKGGGMFWTYKASDQRAFGATIKRALADGYKGQMPDLYVPPAVKKPKPNAGVVTVAVVATGGLVASWWDRISIWIGGFWPW